MQFIKDNVLAIALFLVIIALGVGWYLNATELKENIAQMSNTNGELFAELEATKDTLASTTMALSTQIAELSEDLEESEDEREDLKDNLRDEKDRNDNFENQIDDLTDTLEVLDKLSKTDEELLQKYSKVSFLNEHYIPENLKEIEDEWKYSESRSHQLHGKVIPFFNDMLEDAKDDGVELWVTSAYRSFETQAQLKGQYLVTYGSGANAFSADQGFSEHQLGTAVDFTTRGLNGQLVEAFANTEAYEWLQDNAHKHGFVLSYPPNNAFYVFEPWHWRFVGEDLARNLKKDDAFFYDWDQREIDTYLISIFD